MTAPAYVWLERSTHVALFGLACWDTVGARLTSDGLSVRLFALDHDKPLAPVTARANRAGVFVAQAPKGLEALARGSGNDAFWSSPPAARPYLVEVRDDTGRYLSFVARVELPVRGLALPECMDALVVPAAASSPLASPLQPKYMPLFPLPAHSVPAGMAVVRASLRETDSDKPAAYAVLEITAADSGRIIARSIADERGDVAVVFPYPEVTPVLQSPLASPPASALPLSEQQWELRVSVRYALHVACYATDPRRPPLPDICAVAAQPYATIVAGSPLAPLSHATLRYGAELVLGQDDGGVLHITPT